MKKTITEREENPFKYSSDNKRYQTFNYFLRQKFGEKVFKVSLNAGLSCPNLDGTKGVGGCTYCSESGSGDFAGCVSDDIVTQFEKIKSLMHGKWDAQKYIGYFQARTNTYAPTEKLKQLYEPILAQKNVVGLSIATRPDCISESCLDYLSEINKRTFLMVELGLQTIHDETGKRINRHHTYSEFLSCYERLRQHGIAVCVHIINGLPGETREDMLETVRELSRLDLFSIKIHLLHIIKGTKLAEEFLQGDLAPLDKKGTTAEDILKGESLYDENGDCNGVNLDSIFPFTLEEYVSLVCDQLELLPPNVVIQRITGDGKKEDLIAPLWSLKKFVIMNDIDKELKRRNSYQGKFYKG